jgi:hypothetical protein
MRRQVSLASTMSVVPSYGWWDSRRAPSRSFTFATTLSTAASGPHVGTVCPLSLPLFAPSFASSCSGTFRCHLHLPRIHCPCYSPPHFPRVRRSPDPHSPAPLCHGWPSAHHFSTHLPSTSIEHRWGSSARMVWRCGPTHAPSSFSSRCCDYEPSPFSLTSLRSHSSRFIFEVPARLLSASSLFSKEIEKKGLLVP